VTIDEKLAGLEARVQDRIESALVRQTRELAGKDDYPPPNHGFGSGGDGHSDGSAGGRGPGSRGGGRGGEDVLQHQPFQEPANRKRTMQRGGGGGLTEGVSARAAVPQRSLSADGFRGGGNAFGFDDA
jgi:hypothetical protein